MKKIEYETNGVCAKKIIVEIDVEDKIHNVEFLGGCSGNLKAISRLIEGMDRTQAVDLLKGNTCGPRDTSCVDQLAKALEQ